MLERGVSCPEETDSDPIIQDKAAAGEEEGPAREEIVCVPTAGPGSLIREAFPAIR